MFTVRGMGTQLRRTHHALAVLSVLDTSQWRYIRDVGNRALVAYNAVGQVLHRFEVAGLVESMEEEAGEVDTFDRGTYTGRARRRYFRLTEAGVGLRQEWGGCVVHRRATGE